MTSLPQTQQRSVVDQDSRRRTAPAVSSDTRQAPPAIDPSKEFGCVDWFLYPHTAAEGQGTRVPA
ncbi:MAG: hypothetical protein ACRETZ_09340 [Steroidobacteraceae bacterium]